MRSSASATPSRRPRRPNAGASVSPSRTSLSRGASPAKSAAVLCERGGSVSPSTKKRVRPGIADDAATVHNGSVSASPNAGHATGSTASPSVTGVSLSHFAQDGRRLEPNICETTFSFYGQYEHITVAHRTATLWCANTATGAMDLYSCVTGQFVTSLLPLHEEVVARRAELSELPLNVPSAKGTNGSAKGATGGLLGSHWGSTALTPRSRGLVPTGGGRRLSTLSSTSATAHHHHTASNSLSASSLASAWARVPEGDLRATALCATATHMWVGYTNGTIAVYDALLLKLVTFGRLHTDRIVSIVALFNGQTVSASTDGLLILWDTEQGGFEAVTRVTVLLDAVREGAGALCAMTSIPPATRVCCGFESGVVYNVRVASRPQEQTAPQSVRGHHGRVNDMAVVRDVLFTAAEDNTVCAWYCGGAAGAQRLDGGDGGGSVPSSLFLRAAHDASRARLGPHKGGSVRMLKRIPVRPCVRCLLAEEQTRSVWVAYADGLVERWSANPDDDYGVEEVVENALAASLSAGNGGVRALLSLSVTQTMQWLALSSNGVNKVWYGHRNTLEIDLAHSISTLAQVVEQDTVDAAAWRERVNLLKQKELERKEKYVCILEQLSEQRVLLRHYDMWKRSVFFFGTRRRRVAAIADTLEKKSRLQLVRRFFNKWGSFYDAQQRHMRVYVLSMALSRATAQQQLQAYFLRWQSYLVHRQVRRNAVKSAQVLARMVDAAIMGSCFHRWRAAAAATTRRQRGRISAEQLALLAHKAQRQVLQRVLRQWVAHHDTQNELPRQVLTAAAEGAPRDGLPVPETSALSRFAGHYARLQQQRRGRHVFQVWRRWTAWRARQASLAAVAALREQQLLHEVRQRFFFRWCQRVHARRVDENTQQLRMLEVELRRAEAEHGDIFEKLQLQRQLDLVLERQAAEEARLAQVKEQLASAEQTCSDLRARQLQRTAVGSNGAAHAGSGGSSVKASSGAATGASAAVELADASRRSSVARFAGTDTDLSLSTTSEGLPLAQQQQQQQVVLSAMSRGHMASNAAWYRSMVDQQRLSPIVLSHMSTEEAVHHVMGQLKGNVVNLYTDLALFRQVKDRRRAGISAVGILLEAFGEVKLLIVTTVRGTSANAASAAAARMGGKATRWPLSMEALDCIPAHHCATVLSAIKTLVVAYDLLQPEDMISVQTTCEEVVVNADWIFLIARACYLRRKPVPPANNRQLI
ncbi:conserved hypothetical protein [Leishmania major strain Friedlin]|uniref:Uncharacterized protein n=1 Tax=Leishmania major TaxID=5664 RepID=Q4QIX8_LEIMA|nr:conserved hypothetical protein [Leishmania major strain Friedlin]CAG9568896.1 WD_domain_-_G-beta_repeat_-_putative [Leishmania major strain Friedlin]CAJ02145.1 conserved hypothetical protein [Leishmania major strain Friedlin]|eukprot:XP_001680870.1 conserved hypothetical protein [Leishmania major strain Friedlin]